MTAPIDTIEIFPRFHTSILFDKINFTFLLSQINFWIQVGNLGTLMGSTRIELIVMNQIQIKCYHNLLASNSVSSPGLLGYDATYQLNESS
jgi:hypothetical protein